MLLWCYLRCLAKGHQVDATVDDQTALVGSAVWRKARRAAAVLVRDNALLVGVDKVPFGAGGLVEGCQIDAASVGKWCKDAVGVGVASHL